MTNTGSWISFVFLLLLAHSTGEEQKWNNMVEIWLTNWKHVLGSLVSHSTMVLTELQHDQHLTTQPRAVHPLSLYLICKMNMETTCTLKSVWKRHEQHYSYSVYSWFHSLMNGAPYTTILFLIWLLFILTVMNSKSDNNNNCTALKQVGYAVSKWWRMSKLHYV